MQRKEYDSTLYEDIRINNALITQNCLQFKYLSLSGNIIVTGEQILKLKTQLQAHPWFELNLNF